MPRSLRTRSPLRWWLIAALPAFGCSGDSSPNAADPGLTPDPRGERPLAASPAAEAYRAMLRSYERVALGRERGVNTFVSTLTQSLTDRGIDPKIVAPIDAKSIGQPMPGGTVANSAPTRRGMTSALRQPFGQLSLALLEASEFSKYYECPLLAPESNEGTSCEKLVQSAVADSKGQLAAAEDAVAQTVRDQFDCLSTTAQEFVTAWEVEGAARGVDAAATYAIYELRAAAQCDDKTNAKAVSYRLGLEQGWALADAQLATALTEVTGTCSTDATAITGALRTRAMGSIDTFVESNLLCDEEDLSRVNSKIVEVETIRREGITAGIDERVQILQRQIEEAIVAAWSPGGACAPPPAVTGGDGGGDPLIVDLDGDGLALATAPRVSFDLLGSGEPQRVRWVGPRDALLAIDRDADGRIGSVHELFGDVGRCGDHPCRDGFDALAKLDRAAQGGNGDGVLDARDESFVRLSLWLDANGDGRTQPGELQPLADHGISALPLTGTFAAEGLQQGFVTSRADVSTGKGRRPLVDAWLRFEAAAR